LEQAGGGKKLFFPSLLFSKIKNNTDGKLDVVLSRFRRFSLQ